MDIVISNNSDKPIYMQVYEQIAAQILNNELPANLCLPSIRMIAAQLNISIITIKNAWEMLEKNGFIYTKSGKGCFVSEFKNSSLVKKKIDLAEEKIKEDIQYYKNLGITSEEFAELIKKHY